MPSFDVVSQVDFQEVDNAVNQLRKEIGTRYDFKGSKSRVERDDALLTVHGDDTYKLEQVIEILKEDLLRRSLDPRVLSFGSVEPASGGLVRQVVTVRQGIETALAKRMVKTIKAAKLKVQAAIQGDELRISGKKRDDLQSVMALLKADKTLEIPLQFINFRD